LQQDVSIPIAPSFLQPFGMPWRPNLIIFYEANLNRVCSRACEAMKFDSFGRQVSGEAMYGALI
jgi:hypothetical protein